MPEIQKPQHAAASHIGPHHTRLLDWAQTRGVKLNGVAPAQIPGKGLGVVALRDIKQGETLVFVPARLLLTVNPNLAKPERGLSPEVSIHGRLAVALVFPAEGCVRAAEEWTGVMPSRREMEEVMPVCWPRELQDMLPSVANNLLLKSRTKLENDLRLVSEKFLPIAAVERKQTLAEVQEEYRYGWLLVNTRCFYWDYPVIVSDVDDSVTVPSKKKAGRPSKAKKWPRDDCMALCPVIDYFNHADDEGCSVSYNEDGFTVTANRDYDSGQELTFSYGKHSNDFLLVEYGFTMLPNSADYLTLDALILPRLSQVQKQLLEEENLLGNYTLFRSTGLSTSTCHRTQCALRLLVVSQRQWSRFVSGATDGEKEQAKVDILCRELLQQYLDQVQISIANAGETEGNEWTEARMSLRRRWAQVEDIIRCALETVQG